MPKVTCNLDKETHQKIDKRAFSLGLTTSVYVRTLVISSLKRQEETLSLNDIHKSIGALIPAMVELIARVENIKSSEVRQRLNEICFRKWKQQ